MITCMKRISKPFSVLLLCVSIASLACSCDKQGNTAWPEISNESRPGVRWWWHGSAVDKENLTTNMEALNGAGIGTVEITPIYGVKGGEHRHIDYLSPQWMKMYKHVSAEGKRLGIQIDMNNGTGWPFGGPEVEIKEAATKVIFQKCTLQGGEKLDEKITVNDAKQKDVATISAVMAYSATGEKINVSSFLKEDGMLEWTAPEGDWTVWAAFNGKTFQKVKRAAPGGEGLVIDHFSSEAVTDYLKKFERAFSASGAPYPTTFFNDSYEVYGANWTEGFFDEFKLRRGYDLQDYIPELNREGDADICARVVADYRETISEVLLDNFTCPWTDWAHKHGAMTRNQAHGSPGNLIDYYAAVDIPECESFGRTRFDIPGLRMDEGMKESDSHPSTLKYASSAAHITGKTYTSSETFTWLTEHFRTSLSQMKPELDLLFLSGVNRMFYHGSTYSPEDAAWPGWLFYATVNMNPNNVIFRDTKGLNDYIARTQSFLQYGSPDNDFLLYLPIYDIWQNEPGLYLMFDIHGMKKKMPAFFDMVVNIQQCGYDADYISDKYLLETRVKKGLLETSGASYKAIIVPGVQYIPLQTLEKLIRLAEEGATVIFTDQLPQDVPGLHLLDARRQALKELLAKLSFSEDPKDLEIVACGKGKLALGTDHAKVLSASVAKPEELSVKHGAQLLRRKHSDGYHYFISMLQNKSIDGYVPLAVSCESAMIYDPLTGESGQAQVRTTEGKQEMYLQLKPGQSLIVKTFSNKKVKEAFYPFYKEGDPENITGDWSFRFTDGMPAIAGEFKMGGSPISWTELPGDSVKSYAGTGRYSISFELPDTKADDWLLDLGKLCESARVYVNGQDAGIVWALPFTVRVGRFLKPGVNTLEIDVTNLPANRIRWYDQQGINWRIFHDINVVSVFYKDIRFDSWDVSPSGLTSSVALIPLRLP